MNRLHIKRSALISFIWAVDASGEHVKEGKEGVINNVM